MKDVIPDFRGGVCNNPHLVILGAGASCAAFKSGDKNGRKLPVMKTIAKDLGLMSALLPKYDRLIDDFELLYSTIYSDQSEEKLRIDLDDAVHQYFLELEIDEKPNIYDYLILSLREKDFIATFNWDPLLLQTYRRHARFESRLPKLIFLHGNVAVGVCNSCSIHGYFYNVVCHRCNRPFEKMPLLYPVGKKNYSANASIADGWTQLKQVFEHAYYITVFGYSAPVTDADARQLMLDALKSNRSRIFSEIEIIDIARKKMVRENWSDFLYSHHYSIIKNFKKSQLWWFPRRSCEALASGTLMNDPMDYNAYPEFSTVCELQDWISHLIEEEVRFEETGVGFMPESKG